MRILIQRVKNASVTVEGECISLINKGLLVFVGICDEDNTEDIEWLTKKITNIRLFDDADGVMNLSVMDIDGEILAVSQFTLMAMTKKGNRPSYIKAAKPDISIPLYEQFCKELEKIEYELIFVSDGSKDGTYDAILQESMKNPRGR